MPRFQRSAAKPNGDERNEYDDYELSDLQKMLGRKEERLRVCDSEFERAELVAFIRFMTKLILRRSMD